MILFSVDPGVKYTAIAVFDSSNRKLLESHRISIKKSLQNRYFYLSNTLKAIRNSIKCNIDRTIVETPRMWKREDHDGIKNNSLAIHQRAVGACLSAFDDSIEFEPPKGVKKAYKTAIVRTIVDLETFNGLSQDEIDATFNAIVYRDAKPAAAS